MIERLQGTVEKVTFLENVSNNLDLCSIVIGFDELKIFYDASLLNQFIGKEVYYTIRPDIIHGVPSTVVCELVEISTIQTISSTDNIKLIPESTGRTICNFESRHIRFGQFYPNRVAFLSSYEFGSSNKAKWFDCTMIDSVSKEFVVRLFATNDREGTVETALQASVGCYVTFDLESTKYGFQTKEIVSLPTEVEESPEVLVAFEIIKSLIDSDPALVEYNSRYDFLSTVRSAIDGEPGYTLVRMASELYMINAIENISTDLNIQSMKRAVVCSRGYMLPHKTNWSKPMLNTNKAISCTAMKADKELLLMLDILSEEEASPTKLTYIKVKGLVNDIINIRRGVENEKDVDTYSAIVSTFNGLL